jgi:hypothetical protein
MTEQKKKRKPTKIYYIQYQTQEKGELDAFPSRRAAQKPTFIGNKDKHKKNMTQKPFTNGATHCLMNVCPIRLNRLNCRLQKPD